MEILPYKNSLFKQIGITTVFFLVLVILLLMYVQTATNQRINYTGKKTALIAQSQIDMLFQKIESSLNGILFITRTSIDEQSSQDLVAKNFNIWAEMVQKKGMPVFPFVCVHGQLTVPETWIPPPNTVWENRDWYRLAVDVKEHPVYCSRFISLRLHRPTVVVSQALYDKAGQICGAAGIGIEYTDLLKFLIETNLSDLSHTVLCNENFEIIAHYDEKLTGKSWDKLGKNEAVIAGEIEKNEGEANARWYRSFNGTQNVCYARRLSNGWYILSITPIGRFYRQQSLRSEIAVFVLCLVCFCVVCLFLVKIDRVKKEAEARNRSKSDFLAKMSHEIRTPMNAVIGMSELILRESAVLPKKVQQYAQSIKQAGTDLVSIINDILDFSKIESGRLKIINNRYMLSSLIDDIVNIIRPRLREKSLNFIVFVDCNLPNNLKGDVVRIRQILLNLLSNAAKYTNGGYVSLSVTGDKQDNGTLILNFAVIDTGIGIKDEDTDRIFDEFMQFDLQANQAQEGTGLGLAITQNFVKLMGGEIQVSSTYGKGSTFTVTLPQEILNEAPFAFVESPLQTSVLLYEPRNTYSTSLTETFENLGIHYKIVANEQDFLFALKQRDYSLVLLDSAFYNSFRLVLSQLPPQTNLVFFSDNTDTVPRQDIPTLPLPVYSLPIVNVLNSNSPSQIYSAKNRDAVQARFRAPTARILLVDDIKINLTVAQGLLAPFECQIDTAANGYEAVNFVKEHEYDIVFMDHMMPGMDGIDATRLIRQSSGGRFLTVPIIAMTANVVAGMKQVFLKNGMDDLLPKPIDLMKLNRIMAKWIPVEKQERVVSERTDSGADNSSGVLYSVNIPGLDCDRGIALAGSAKNYLRVVKTFRADAEAKSESIRSAYRAKDWKLYAVSVHGLKSALANVGATELSILAEELVQAGRNRSISFIAAETEPFLLQLEQIVESTEDWLQSHQTVTLQEDTSLFKEMLEKIRTGLKDMDAKMIHDSMDTLHSQHWSKEAGELLAHLEKQITLFDYNEAVEAIDNFLDGKR
ncbi:hypothetical protein FACS189419_07770 [Planctomycetales bacterium]|nr:hypothetical protein FACS189419_07770 [Planctomycetales bacterium]